MSWYKDASRSKLPPKVKQGSYLLPITYVSIVTYNFYIILYGRRPTCRKYGIELKTNPRSGWWYTFILYLWFCNVLDFVRGIH